MGVLKHCAVFAMLSGCFGVDPIQDPTRPFKERDRAREAAKWAGTYTFGECAQAGRCWRYWLSIASDGSTGLVVVEGEDGTRINAKPRPSGNTVTFSFESYADGQGHYEWIPAGLGPAFRPSERLVFLVKDPQKLCLRFERLTSKLGTKELCTPWTSSTAN